MSQVAKHREEQIPPPQPNARWLVASALALLIAVCVAYAPSIHGEFLFDDKPYVVERPKSHLENLDWESIHDLLAVDVLQPHRWLSHLSFALNFYTFGESPTSFHVVNVLIHVMTSLGVALLSWTTFRQMGWDEARARRGAIVAACVFALHPIQTQSVSYIWQRTAEFVSMWIVWGLWCFAMARRPETKRRWPYVIGAVACGVLGPLTKQNGILLPPLMWLYHLAVFSDRSRRSLLHHLGVALGVVALGLFTAWALWARDSGWDNLLFRKRDFTMGERLMTQPRVIWLYLKLIVLPLPTWLNIDHHVVFSTGLLSPWSTLPAAFGVLALIAFGVWNLRGRPLVGLAVCWFFLCHVPESTFMPLELVFEHRNYLPMVGIAWLIAMAVDRLPSRPVGALLIAVLAVSYTGATYHRNGFYQTEEILFRDASRKSPDKARPYNILGHAHFKRREYSQAAGFYEKSIEKNPKDSGTYTYLGLALANQGQFDRAVDAYRQSIAISDQDPGAHHNLGLALGKLGRTQEAIREFHRAIELKADFSEAHHSLANALVATGHSAEAQASYAKAIEFDPTLVKSYINWSTVLFRESHFRKAMAVLRRGLLAADQNPTLYDALARILLDCPDPSLRNPAEAESLARRSVELTQHRDPQPLITLFRAQATTGQLEMALQTAGQAAELARQQRNTALLGQIRTFIQRIQQQRAGSRSN